jgi:pimeloyl-ACP methyl ester carboxylesterase
MQVNSRATRCSLVLVAALLILSSASLAAAPAPREMQSTDRKDLPGGLVRERLRLPGFDPDEPVPAIAIHPASGGPFPVAIALHSFRGAKENMEAWCRDLAGRGIFAIAIDAHLHGERSIAGIFHGEKIASLGDEYSIWVHQTSIARTVKDIPIVLDALARRSDVDASRVAATGVSMGGSTAMVLAWREPRVRVVASVVGAVDFWWDVIEIPPGPAHEAKKASYGPRLRELVASIDPRTRLDRIPPKALCLINGGRDEYIDIESVRRFVADIEPLYGQNRARVRLAPFPEAGHGVTADMWKEAQEWIVRGLEAVPSSPARTGIAPATTRATFYVAVDGRVESDGSLAQPWPSVEYALSKVGAGNTIIVKPGIYQGRWQIRNHPAKSDGPPTIIRSEVKWKAALHGGSGEAINVVDCPGIVIDGFEVSGARGDGISMNSDRGTVRNRWVHNNDHMGISSHNHRGVRIEANLIEFNGCNIQFHHGVYADGEGLTVCRNIIRHNSGYGLHLYPSIKDSVVSQNLVLGHVYQSGIIVACPEGGGRNLIVHNTVVGNGACIAIWRGDGERVFNNILVSAGDILSLSRDTKNVMADYNLCRPSLAHQGPHSQVADPRFVRAECGVFWLRPDSPAIGKGTSEYAPATDFWDRALPAGQLPDQGAFAFVPSLAADKARIGWNGWPYRFAPKGEMDLMDPWTQPEDGK